MSAFYYHVTYVTYTIYFLSLSLLALSTATLILQSSVMSVFHDLQIQRPGSNLVEWAFVSLNPPNLDTGSGIGILITGACGVISSIGAGGWTIALWAGCRANKTRLIGLGTCLMLTLSTSVSIGIMAYVFITEAGMRLPDAFRLWSTVEFTQEFYICTAFPSLIPDADELVYGFRACGVAKSARYLLIGITIASILLAGLAAMQAWKSGAVRMLTHSGLEFSKAHVFTPTLTTTRTIVTPKSVHLPEMARDPQEIRKWIELLPLKAPVLTTCNHTLEISSVDCSPERKNSARSSVFGYYRKM